MPAAAKKSKSEKSEKSDVRYPYAMLVDLEGVGVAVRQAEFETLCTVLEPYKVTMTPAAFVRHCLTGSPSQYLGPLLDTLGARVQPSRELAKEVENGIALYLSSPEAVPHPTVHALIQSAQNRLEQVLITRRKAPQVEALVERWDVPDAGLHVLAFEAEGDAFPAPDIWRRAAQSLARTPRHCIAVVGSRRAAKAALAAGLRCVAIPDEYTRFEDFGGVDMVVDDPGDVDPDELLTWLAPATM